MVSLVREFECSDVRLSEFCAQHGVSEKRLTWWQRECRRRDTGTSDDAVVQSTERVDFVEVVAVAEPPVASPRAACSPTGAIRIVLSGWRHVEVEPGFDEMTLARTVQVLESLPC
jgi:hypothetical protein